MEIGIDGNDIVRLGSKSTTDTEPLLLKNKVAQRRSSGKDFYTRKLAAETELSTAADDVNRQSQSIQQAKVAFQDLMDYLEFEGQEYHSAFQLPTQNDGMKVVGKGGKALSDDYLFSCWVNGHEPLYGGKIAEGEEVAVWSLPKDKRAALIHQWTTAILEEKFFGFYTKVSGYNDSFRRKERIHREQNIQKISNHRIIGCTTTAAAMYTQDIQAAAPTTVLVEEAGEILESHILSAIGPSTQRLILIGDHKQLRPKANSYKLSVEKGDGYDLNMSLFERLVLGGLKHNTLSKQHRMSTEISCFVRELTYPELVDGPGTEERPPLRGFESRVMFVQHEKPEKDAALLREKRNKGEATSKENTHEIELVLKCVRYLGQQGYGTKDIVVLTPYLGQLFLLKESLKKTHDPILNDLDAHDLIEAGVMGAFTANVHKKPIKISTIGTQAVQQSESFADLSDR